MGISCKKDELLDCFARCEMAAIVGRHGATSQHDEEAWHLIIRIPTLRIRFMEACKENALSQFCRSVSISLWRYV